MAKRLITADDIRRYQAWLCRHAELDLMPVTKANFLSLIASRALKAIEVGSQEEIRQMINNLQEEIDNV